MHRSTPALLILARLAGGASAQAPDGGAIIGALLGAIGSAVPLASNAGSSGGGAGDVLSAVTGGAGGGAGGLPGVGSVDTLKSSLAGVTAGLVSPGAGADAIPRALGSTALAGAPGADAGGGGVAALAPFLGALGGRRLLAA